jgi:hypothetical protein
MGTLLIECGRVPAAVDLVAPDEEQQRRPTLAARLLRAESNNLRFALGH